VEDTIMIWLTWRQFRPQAILAGVAIAAVAITLAITGPHLVGLYSSSGLNSCGSSCAKQANTFIGAVKGSATELVFYGSVVLLYVAPAVMGVFWGAPLVTREFEAGTYRLAWNQSVTRTRWLGVKLGLVGGAAAATAGVLSLMISWWASPIYHAASQAGGPNSLSISRFEPTLFGVTGIVPIGYAAFAFALGVTVGVLIRRLLPAMVITLAVFAAVQILMPVVVRPHLIPPLHGSLALSTVSFDGMGDTNNGHLILNVQSMTSRPSDWIVGSQPVDASGRPAIIVPRACTSAASTFLPCLASHGVRLAISYQPASRYWAFQWLETGIFVLVALALGGCAYLGIRRRA
jgi:hypothetical protein